MIKVFDVVIRGLAIVAVSVVAPLFPIVLTCLANVSFGNPFFNFFVFIVVNIAIGGFVYDFATAVLRK